ncbi:MAG TPA: ankyrin repeat domain-containing protein, partial [Vicinamibacterales bacterium]|nr:ankyrin repeat domain-containing protein [Vicinamibacterales bacterium]
MTTPHLPTRRLRDRPDLDQLKRQAKELLDGFTAGDAASVAEVGAHFHDADPATFSLQQAQLVLARAYGFDSWPKFKAFVDGATVDRLIGAVRDGRLEDVRALLHQRPELARMSKANFGVIHYAVLDRRPEMVRLLMQHGASARQGVYPHREATTAHAIAAQRGYADIVRIIEDAEQ